MLFLNRFVWSIWFSQHALVVLHLPYRCRGNCGVGMRGRRLAGKVASSSEYLLPVATALCVCLSKLHVMVHSQPHNLPLVWPVATGSCLPSWPETPLHTHQHRTYTWTAARPLQRTRSCMRPRPWHDAKPSHLRSVDVHQPVGGLAHNLRAGRPCRGGCHQTSRLCDPYHRGRR